MNNPIVILEKLAVRTKPEEHTKKTFTSAARRMIEQGGWRYELYKVLYRSKILSVILLFLIVLSSSAVIVQSVPAINTSVGYIFIYTEWFFTIVFSIEYFLRIIVAPKPFRYIFSTIGIIDFISIFPMYLGFLGMSNTNYLVVVRSGSFI